MSFISSHHEVCGCVCVYKCFCSPVDSRASVLQRITKVLNDDCVHYLKGFRRPVLPKEDRIISRRVLNPLRSGILKCSAVNRILKCSAVNPSRLCFPALLGQILSFSPTPASSPRPGTEQGLSQNLFFTLTSLKWFSLFGMSFTRPNTSLPAPSLKLPVLSLAHSWDCLGHFLFPRT